MAFGATSLQLGFPWHLLRQRCPPCPTKSSSGHTGRTSRGVPCGHANQQKGRTKPLKLSQRHNQGTPTRPHCHGLLSMEPTQVNHASEDQPRHHLFSSVFHPWAADGSLWVPGRTGSHRMEGQQGGYGAGTAHGSTFV